MNKAEICALMKSDRTLNSIYTVLGKALIAGKLDWINDLFIQGTSQEKLFMYLNNLTTLPLCKMCNKNVRFLGYSRGFRDYCCTSCVRRHEVQTGKSIEIKVKARETLKKNYGVETPFGLESSRIAQREAMKLKRGISVPIEVKERSKTTLRDRYGVENPGQILSVRTKVTKTMQDRYGGYYIEKLGPALKHQRWITRITEILDKNLDIELLDPLISSKVKMRAKHRSCGTEFMIDVSDGNISKCPKCFFQPANRSKLEDEWSKFVKELGFVVLTNVKSSELIWPLTLDIWVPEKRIAIEVNGDYYHNSIHITDDYHLKKLRACEAKGIKLIQVFEHELMNKKQQVENRLKSLLGIYSQKVGARECKIIEVDVSTQRKFLDEGHLQGYVAGSYSVGLERNGELLMLMTIGHPRFNHETDLELLRVCTKPGVLVFGGGTKLLSHVRKRFFGSIVSYHDKRWGTSNFYQNLGFKFIRDSDPSFIYVKGNKKLSRYQAQKQRIPAILGDKFDPTLTTDANMLASNWNKIYDCGQEVYHL